MPTESSARLSIAVVGMGRIGSAFAYQLASAGHQVTAVARADSSRLHQLQRDGGVVLSGGERAHLAVEDHLEEQVPYDLVIVSTLAGQVDEVLPALRRSRARCVLFMFVTPEGERLASAVGPERTTFGMASVLSTLDGGGRLKLEIQRAKALQGDQRWVELFEAAGLPSRLQPDMARWLRSQTPLTIAMESVAGVGMARGRGASWAEAGAGAEGLRAGYQILRALGEAPYPRSKDQLSRLPKTALRLLLWGLSRSKFRETVGNSANEVRGLVDLVVAEAGTRAARSDIEAVLALRPAS